MAYWGFYFANLVYRVIRVYTLTHSLAQRKGSRVAHKILLEHVEMISVIRCARKPRAPRLKEIWNYL